ncbi:hypothetical protein LEMLEM_LOCUS21998 [Lemmus lemmus]
MFHHLGEKIPHVQHGAAMSVFVSPWKKRDLGVETRVLTYNPCTADLFHCINATVFSI